MPKMPGEPSAHERHDQLVELLDQDWQTYESLMEQTGKPERTLRRDLDHLEELGYKLESARTSRGKRFRLVPGSRKQPIEPGILEILAAHLGKGMLGFLQGTELSTQMESLLDKLRKNARVSEQQLEGLSSRFWFMADAPREYRSSDAALHVLIGCLIESRLARITYRSSLGDLRDVRLRAYTLIVRRECLYILGAEELAPEFQPGPPRLFDITRMERVRAGKEIFSLPEGWNPSSCFKDSFGVFIPRADESPPSRVRIRFRADVARTIRRRRWHESQRWHDAGAAGFVLEMSVRPCPELVHWILSFGPAAVVEGPESLKQQVRTELEAALEPYRRGGG